MFYLFKKSGFLFRQQITPTSLSGLCLNRRCVICSNNGTAISQLIATSELSAVNIHCHFCCWDVLNSSATLKTKLYLIYNQNKD